MRVNANGGSFWMIINLVEQSFVRQVVGGSIKVVRVLMNPSVICYLNAVIQGVTWTSLGAYGLDGSLVGWWEASCHDEPSLTISLDVTQTSQFRAKFQISHVNMTHENSSYFLWTNFNRSSGVVCQVHFGLAMTVLRRANKQKGRDG